MRETTTSLVDNGKCTASPVELRDVFSDVFYDLFVAPIPDTGETRTVMVDPFLSVTALDALLSAAVLQSSQKQVQAIDVTGTSVKVI